MPVTIRGNALSRSEYSFSIVLQMKPGLSDIVLDAVVDRLYEQGCDDALFEMSDGLLTADFDRKGETFEDAVLSAINDIEDIAPELTVLRLRPDDLVSAATIAARTSRSRESISKLVNGERGPRNFPQPATWVADKRPFWRWSEVARWFQAYDEAAGPMESPAPIIGALNAMLDLRNLSRAVMPSTRQKLMTWTVAHAFLLPSLTVGSVPLEVPSVQGFLSTMPSVGRYVSQPQRQLEHHVVPKSWVQPFLSAEVVAETIFNLPPQKAQLSATGLQSTEYPTALLAAQELGRVQIGS